MSRTLPTLIWRATRQLLVACKTATNSGYVVDPDACIDSLKQHTRWFMTGAKAGK
jgi:hypothetical protein